ncbi:unnamed protein product, partial [Protopolystoma xenopodis]
MAEFKSEHSSVIDRYRPQKSQSSQSVYLSGPSRTHGSPDGRSAAGQSNLEHQVTTIATSSELPHLPVKTRPAYDPGLAMSDGENESLLDQCVFICKTVSSTPGRKTSIFAPVRGLQPPPTQVASNGRTDHLEGIVGKG